MFLRSRVFFLTLWLMTYGGIATSLAEDKPSKEPSYVMCKNGATVRTLHIDQKKGNWVASYTKSGKDQVICQAKQLSFCQSVLTGIRENLEKSNWSCRELGAVQVNAGDEERSPAISQ